MISNKDIKNLSLLARIELTEEEGHELKKDIESILDYVGQIQALKIDSSENIQEENILKNVFRDDVDPHEKGVYSEKLLKEAPRKKNGYVQVKKIL